MTRCEKIGLLVGQYKPTSRSPLCYVYVCMAQLIADSAFYMVKLSWQACVVGAEGRLTL